MPQSTSRTLSVFPLLLLLAACGPAPHDIVILHGRVMNPETGLDAPLNVGIDDGRIAAITEEDLRDGIPFLHVSVHPRGAGTFARILGHYSRDRGAIGLMEALAKMTILPARRLEGAAAALPRTALATVIPLTVSR